MGGQGPARAGGHRRRAGSVRRVRPLRPGPSVLPDRRGGCARRRQPRRQRLRLRARVLDLDHDRGVPEPAGRLGEGPRLVHASAVLRAGGLHVPGRDRAGRVRARRARGGAVDPAVGRLLGARPSSTGWATSSSRCSRRCTSWGSTRPTRSRCAAAGEPARRRGGVSARPRDARPADERQDVRRHVGHGHRAPTATPREVYLYHVVDNEETWGRDAAQAVVWQTAINPVVALELLANGAWSGAGVLGPRRSSPMPFLDLLTEYGSPVGDGGADPRLTSPIVSPRTDAVQGIPLRSAAATRPKPLQEPIDGKASTMASAGSGDRPRRRRRCSRGSPRRSSPAPLLEATPGVPRRHAWRRRRSSMRTAGPSCSPGFARDELVGSTIELLIAADLLALPPERPRRGAVPAQRRRAVPGRGERRRDRRGRAAAGRDPARSLRAAGGPRRPVRGRGQVPRARRAHPGGRLPRPGRRERHVDLRQPADPRPDRHRARASGSPTRTPGAATCIPTTSSGPGRSTRRRTTSYTTLNHEYRMVHEDGTIRWVLEQAFPIDDEHGSPWLIQGVIFDITERKNAEEQVAFLAYHDKLTGLPNRALFEEMLESAIARGPAQRRGGRCAVPGPGQLQDGERLARPPRGRPAARAARRPAARPARATPTSWRARAATSSCCC